MRRIPRSPTTAPYYVWRIIFTTRDLPKLRVVQYLPAFTHTAREIYVKQRQIRDLLLEIDPGARYEKHEARQCPWCHLWRLGIQAQMMREREMVARLNGKKLGRCGDGCVVT